MMPADRAMFVAAYSSLVAAVWSDPSHEAKLMGDPTALLAEHGLQVPPNVQVTVLRDVEGAEPNLESQVESWERAGDTGRFTLVVPSMEPVAMEELREDELDSVVGGIDSSCACCCPCCCT